jgi:ABC-type phosphate transport system substrate-binding protein
MNTRTTLLSLLLALLAWPALAASDLVVVVNAKSEVGHLSRDDVVNIYLGRYRMLPDGAGQLQSALTVKPLDYPASSAERAAFYERLVNKSVAEINAYWARLVFSGKVLPPDVVSTSHDVLAFVAANPRAIGYLERARVDGRVRVVYDLETGK